ncbi:RNA 2',3'-cyclic phosphodiesterase [Halobacteria archaeon AArc-m2/3/4]|uniref:RNA 2',3'-cyclic phosphodiesterase n=1 Tax=Natronoglomus mannanivorans TaxID=2979990 RepID=A0ABT2QAQ1_9EURY|nr:RNA 2',3'-cyclic phosphodiesterase [Halobacteria archaeon AArc-m2/3/4]
MRLFVSVDVPDELTDAVVDLQNEFADADGLNLTDPSQAHLTLKFLGDVEADRLPDLRRELAGAVVDADVGPFTARFEGLGVFPSLEYISVVWLGVEDGSEELTRLHETIEERTTAMGFEPESHEFTPHVTLARMEHASGKERVQRLVREHNPVVGETTVESIHLTESTLTEDGPVYTTVGRFSFSNE